MHKHTEASVKMGEDLSNFVNIERGVKQGDSLRPNLFKIYINDLPDIFDDSHHPVTLETLSLKCLMFAEGLQKSLDKLNEYCKKWQLSVNVKL